MTIDQIKYIGIDVLALLILITAVYLPKYKKKEMVLPFVVLNLSIMGISIAMLDSTITAGLGLGLLGVLSIIRLRSTELTQSDIAYYFTSLTLGLIAGLQIEDWILFVLIIGLIIIGVLITELINPKTINEQQRIILDEIIADESELKAKLNHIVNGKTQTYSVEETDLTRQTMKILVSYTKGVQS